MRTRSLAGLICLSLAPLTAHAVTVYRCTAADGAIGYQDKPCPAHRRQSTLQLSDAPIVSPPPVATTSAPASAASVPPAPIATPAVPLPTMYACTSYDGEKHYLSDNLPAPYPVPLGAMGYPSQSLDQAYGGRDRLGLSAPEESGKPMIGNGPLIANAMVEVRDYCHPATRTQVCDELKHRYDANHAKLRMAFPSEQQPLEQREAQLREQMSGC